MNSYRRWYQTSRAGTKIWYVTLLLLICNTKPKVAYFRVSQRKVDVLPSVKTKADFKCITSSGEKIKQMSAVVFSALSDAFMVYAAG